MDTQSILMQADRFHHAALCLNSDSLLLIPSWMNGALALELYYKCLHQILYGKVPHTHQLYTGIYKKLPTEIQEHIKSNFNNEVGKRPKESLNHLENHDEIPFSRDLEFTLREAEKVFIGARYIFEDNSKPWTFILYEEAQASIRAELVHQCPDVS